MKQKAQDLQAGIDDIVQYIHWLSSAPIKFVTAFYSCSNNTTGIDIIIPYSTGIEEWEIYLVHSTLNDIYYPLLCSQYYNHKQIEPVRALQRILAY